MLRNVKQLISVRHGKYQTEDLTREGCIQVSHLSEIIRRHVKPHDKVAVFHSGYSRAVQTARIIFDVLMLGDEHLPHVNVLKECKHLNQDNYGLNVGMRILQSIDRKRHGDETVIITVGHFEAVSAVVDCAISEFKINHEILGPTEPANGSGWRLDIEDHTVLELKI